MTAFWQRYPALLYGLFLYLGCHAALNPSWVFLIPLSCLIVPCFIGVKSFLPIHFKMLLACGIGLVSFFWVHTSVRFPPSECAKILGRCIVEIDDISQGVRFGNFFWKYKITIRSFESYDGKVFVKNIPATMTWKETASRPKGKFLYEGEALLKRVHETDNFLITPTVETWQKKARVLSVSELRLKMKRAFKLFLYQFLPPNDVRAFLEGVVIGDFHDQLISSHLKRFGLQHILVVSGFHFSLTCAFLAYLLRPFLPFKLANIGLILGSFLYLLFIGLTPSVVRAGVSVIALFLTKVFEKTTNGLNSLGLGLIGVLLYQPALCLNLGFQLSFLATAAILLLYSPVENALKSLFPKHSVDTILQFSTLDQIFYLFLKFFRSSIALALAVSILMLPMTLYVFHSFPFTGLLYNCFFPFLTAISMTLLSFGLIFFWLPFLANLFFQLAYATSDLALTFVSYAPSFFDCTMHVEHFPDWLIASLLSGTCLLGIYLRDKKSLEISYV